MKKIYSNANAVNLKGKVRDFSLFLLIFEYNKRQQWLKDLLTFLMKRVSLEKKINLEKKMILDKIKDIERDININLHKVENFLLIFHTI